MKSSRFYLLFGITLISLCVFLYLISLSAKMQHYIDIAYMAVPAFGLLSLVIYYLTIFMEKREDRSGLFNIVVVNLMLKFLISAVVIAIYYNTKNPSDGIFVVPFIVIYVAFTIFETYFMSEQARTK